MDLHYKSTGAVRMAPSAEHSATSYKSGSERSQTAPANVGSTLGQPRVHLTAKDLLQIQNAVQAGSPKRSVEEKGKLTKNTVTTSGICAGACEFYTRSSKRIEDKINQLAGEGPAQFKTGELETLVSQGNREVLIERAELLLRANTDQHRALKAGLMRSDWLGSLKEQEKWKQHLNDLEMQREQHYRRMWEEDCKKALRRQEEEKLRLQEKIQELKTSRFRQLEENRVKRENDKVAVAEEARQLRERLNQENRKFDEDEKQRRARYKQMHIESLELISKARKETRGDAVKLQRKEDAAALVEKTAPLQHILEERVREMRQRRVELQPDANATLPLGYVVKNAQQRGDFSKGELSLPVGHDVRAQRAEQHRVLAEDRLRQQQTKLEARAMITREDAAFVDQWREENARLLMMEERKKEERQQQLEETVATLKKQIAAAKEKKQREREDEKNAVKAALSAIEKDEKTVEALQLRCIENAIRDGNSHWPIVNSLSRHSASFGRLRHRNGGEETYADDNPESEESSTDC